MPRFDRAPKKPNRRRTGALLTGVAAVGAAWLATRDGKVLEKPQADDAADVTPRDTARRGHASEQSPVDLLENEDPNLSDEDAARAREHAAFKQRMADALAEALPGYSVRWTTSTDGKPEYDEFLQIFTPKGKRLGDVYPDEVDGSMRFNPDEDLLSLYSEATGTPLVSFDSNDPLVIARAAQDTEHLASYEADWKQFQQEWPQESHFVTSEDGTVSMNPDYTAAHEALSEEMLEEANNSETVTTKSESEQRAEDAAEAADTGE